MENKVYTVEKAAEILNLHAKTVTRYINENKLKAAKIGHQWRILESDLNNFIKNEPLKSSPSIEEEYHSDVSEVKHPVEKISVSTVIDLKVSGEEEGSRLSNSIIAMLNCKDPSYGDSSYKYIYYPDTRKARFLLWGTPIFVSHILDVFAQLYENQV